MDTSLSDKESTSFLKTNELMDKPANDDEISNERQENDRNTARSEKETSSLDQPSESMEESIIESSNEEDKRESFSDSDTDELKIVEEKIVDASPRTSSVELQRVESTTSLSAASASSCANDKDASAFPFNRRKIDTELEQIRCQVNFLAQQNSMQMQMISYLASQMKVLRNQRNSIGSESMAPNLAQMHPFLQLLSSYNPASLLDPTSMYQGFPAMTNSVTIGGVSANAEDTSVRRSRLSEEAKPNDDTRQLFLKQWVGGDKLPTRQYSEKSSEQAETASSNGTPVQNITDTSDSLSNVKRDATSSSSSNHGQRGSPQNFPLEKPSKNQCRTCGKILSCGSALKLHYRTHTGERPYSCDICPRAFTTRGNLRTHYSSVHHRELPPATSFPRRNQDLVKSNSGLFCHLCSFSCDTEAALTQHMLVHSNQTGNLLALQQQRLQHQQAFPSRNLLAQSLESNLTNNIPNLIPDPKLASHNNDHLQPPELNREKLMLEILKDRERLTANETGHPSPAALDLSTNASEKQNDYKAASQLIKHDRELNSDEISTMILKEEETRLLKRGASERQMLHSNYAKTVANGVQALENHQPRFYACRICFRRFQREEDLNKHLLSHENLSGAFSAANDQFEDTPRTGHKRPLEKDPLHVQEAKKLRSWCDICKKQFSSASSLAIHMRTHTGEKPYSCSICQRAFTTRGNLKVHMNIHEYGVGGSRRGRRISGSKKITNGEAIGRSQTEETNDTTLAFLQRYTALANMVNGNQGNISSPVGQNFNHVWLHTPG